MPEIVRPEVPDAGTSEQGCEDAWPWLHLESYLAHGAVWTVFTVALNPSAPDALKPIPLVAKFSSPKRFPMVSTETGEEWDRASISGAIYSEVLAYDLLSAFQGLIIPRSFGAWAGVDGDGKEVWVMLVERVGDEVEVKDLVRSQT